MDAIEANNLSLILILQRSKGTAQRRVETFYEPLGLLPTNTLIARNFAYVGDEVYTLDSLEELSTIYVGGQEGLSGNPEFWIDSRTIP